MSTNDYAADRAELLSLVAGIAYERRRVVLRSGRVADFYMDCRRVTLHPRGSTLCGRVFWEEFRRSGLGIAAVGGPTMGADPLVTAFQMTAHADGVDLPAFLVRKQAKDHGTASRIEGRHGLATGSDVLLLEDVLTTGGSLLEARDAVIEDGLKPVAAMVLVDRCEGGTENMDAAGIRVISVFKADEVAAEWERLDQARSNRSR